MGKRNYYATPIRMFLLITFLMLFTRAFHSEKQSFKPNIGNITVDSQDLSDEDIQMDSVASQLIIMDVLLISILFLLIHPFLFTE